MITLTKKLIEACESLDHAYTSASLRFLGAMGEDDLFPAAGWKERITGSKLSESSYEAALDSRSTAFFEDRETKKQLLMF